jgi:hypothetical protein
MRNISDERSRENQNPRFMFGKFFFLKSYRLRDNVEKYCRAKHATDDIVAHAYCRLDT